MKDVDVEHDWFKYNKDESIVKGDALLDDGRRVILMSTNDHFDLMARSPQLLGDGTFRITPSLWLQVFIISAQIFGSVFVPVCFCLLSDKKRETYDLMFSMLKEALADRGLDLSAENFMDFEVVEPEEPEEREAEKSEQVKSLRTVFYDENIDRFVVLFTFSLSNSKS